MISHKQRCIFVHIPKTGGQSIETYFRKLNNLKGKRPPELVLNKNDDPNKGPARLAHMRAHEYVDFNYLTNEQYQQYFSFTFVRNPWSRAVSEYLHKKHDRKFSFKHFIFDGLPEQNDFCDFYRHMIPQSDYILDSQGQPIVDFIGRFESLSEDFTRICERMELADTTLPHVNSTSSFRRSLERKFMHLFKKEKRIKANYREYYDQECIERIETLYKSDIERFNYTF